MFESMETADVELESSYLERETSTLFFDKTPFAEGGVRYAHKAYTSNLNRVQCLMVLKMSKDPLQRTKSSARLQVSMQARCIWYAEQFNREPNIPKQVTFIPCILVKFLTGQWAGSYGCIEEFMPGNYVKHNNANPRCDGVAHTNRNTPQAFSHYTYEKSNRTEMVVDVQGVGDKYTDPQLYSAGDFRHYGIGDWNKSGVARFFENHECNNICQSLRLPSNKMKNETNIPLATRVCYQNLMPMPMSMSWQTSTVALITCFFFILFASVLLLKMFIDELYRSTT